MPASLAFVDSISGAAATRLSISDQSPWKTLETSRFDPPPLRRAIVDGGVLFDGSQIPASAHDNRVLRINLFAEAASEDALGTALQNLNRELDRSANILRLQTPGATNPVFFRTFRAPDYRKRHVSGKHQVYVELEIPAEPYALGLREDIAAATINADPAAGSNGCYMEIAAASVKGEVPTPAFIRETTTTRRVYIIAVRQHGTPADLPFFTQAESATLGTDTTNPGGGPDAGMSGAGTNNFVRTSFATDQSMVTRLTIPGSVSDAQGLALRGVFRVFAAVRRSSASGVINLQMSGNNKVPTLLSTSRQYVDLGLIEHGAGTPSAAGYSNIALPVDPGGPVISAERLSGGSTLDWDVIFRLPADEGLCIIDYTTADPSNDRIIDGPNDQIYRIEDGGDPFSAATQMSASTSASRVGAIPLLVPNQAQRIYLLCSTGSAAGALDVAALTSSQSFNVSYWPRYLYIRA